MQRFIRFTSIILILFFFLLLQSCSKGCRRGEEAKLKQAEELIKKNEHKEASKILDEIIKNNPKSEKAYELRIKLNLQGKKQKEEELLGDYDKVVEIKGSEQLPLLKEICLNMIRYFLSSDDAEVKMGAIKAVADLGESSF